jgi:predicted secreted protein
MVGVGGTRTWVILASGTGNQTFSATYLRSWEPVTGNETGYALGIRIEPQ